MNKKKSQNKIEKENPFFLVLFKLSKFFSCASASTSILLYFSVHIRKIIHKKPYSSTPNFIL